MATYQNVKFVFEFIDLEGKPKKAKISAMSIYDAKKKFANRYPRDKRGDFITCYEAESIYKSATN